MQKDDVIYRQAAIDEIRKCRFVVDALEKIRGLPSAQPEHLTGVQDILQYLDKYLHQIVSPEHWSIYSELYDMVSMLPSAQPEPISEAYAKAVMTWLVQYQIKCAELQGRYTPYEVLGWIVNDWRKDNGIDGINQ